MRHANTATALLFLLFFAVLPRTALSSEAAVPALRVTFLTPSLTQTHPFWNDYVDFMQAAARSLGINLTVVSAKHRLEVMKKAKAVLSQAVKPDYLVYIYHAQSTFEILNMAEEAGVKSFITNTDIIPAEQDLVGLPRGKYASWIGHIYPDDIQAGRQLAQRLIQEGLKSGKTAADGRLHLIGIGGNLDATSSLYRKEGFLAAANEYPEALVDRFILANWNRDLARDKTARLVDMYPDTKVWWAIHDNTAFGILDGLRQAGLVPGRDAITGGIDWSPEGIEAVKKGEMVATFGGHFMEGAWALIMILDYHNGHDFADPSPTLHSQMRLMDRDSLGTYAPVLNRDNWEKIDFKRFSKTYNPAVRKYDLSPDAVVRALAGQ